MADAYNFIMTSSRFPARFAGFQARDDADATHLFVRVAGDGKADDAACEVCTGLRALSGAADEYWISPAPVRRGVSGAWRTACNDDVLFAWSPAGAAGAEDFAHDAYARMLALMDESGVGHLVRAWHYIPRLNAREGDDTRYAAFCRGRRRALGDDTRRGFCATTVVGTHSETGLSLFVAARTPGAAIENPRQTSAHDYPRPPADAKPLFARATAVDGGLFVSGTASIVGSESVGAGDAAAEFDETLRNMEALLGEAGDFSFADAEYLKVYLADPAGLAAVRARIEAAKIACPVAFFHGEVCRAELTVEAEALFKKHV